MLVIPSNVKVLFVLSDGKEHELDRIIFTELSTIYSWLRSRLPEFQKDIYYLSNSTESGKFSLLKLHSFGEKYLIVNAGEHFARRSALD